MLRINVCKIRKNIEKRERKGEERGERKEERGEREERERKERRERQTERKLFTMKRVDQPVFTFDYQGRRERRRSGWRKKSEKWFFQYR